MLSPLVLALALSHVAQEPAEREEGRVEVSLVSELAAVPPGKTFWIGLRYEIEEHWHIYWENAGESGMPTRAELTGPPGFEIGPAQFPGPQRFELAGGIVSYGYEDVAMLLFEVRAPEELVEGTELAFRARSSWLVCKEACFLGDGEAELALKAGTSAPDESTPDARAVASFEARLPKPLDELEGARASWSGTIAEPVLEIVLPPGEEPEGYPAEERGLELVESKLVPLEGGGHSLKRSYRFRPRKEGDLPRARVVIGLGAGAERRFYTVEPAWVAPKGNEGAQGG